MLQESSQTTQIDSVDPELPFMVRLYLNKVMIIPDLECAWKIVQKSFFLDEKGPVLKDLPFWVKNLLDMVTHISDLECAWKTLQ